MRVAIAALSCLLALPAFAGALTPDNEARILEQCGASSQAEMRDCLTKRMVETQRVLGDTEKKTAAAIAAWDEDEKFRRAAHARLGAASQAFERYREAQCALSVSLGGGAIGSALELRRLSCVAAANEIRTEQLRHWSESLPRR